MENNSSFRILLYYKYVHIDNYEAFASEHLAFCKELGVKGRILIAEEGINGTLSGTMEQTKAYMEYMHKHPLFSDMVFKIDESETHAFKKLFVRPKKELVTLRYETPLDPNVISGERLAPKEFFEKLQSEDVIVLDGRNDYEYDLGHFRNAIRPNVESFREFPEWIRENLQDVKDKQILTYCTGGIRCEKLTGVLLNEGFTNVAQLDGGIATYGKDPEVQGRLFDGKMYVFDERISVRINQTDEDVVIGKCHHCGSPTDHYINCADDLCHKQHLVCEDCLEEHEGYCSDECKDNDAERHAV
ncbi:rhodanese-related sulfurtransferase [Paenibacillus sp. JX-17]|uniref:tRNA uridine(34) hydroxylase n=1 Tax=Paenibacillus lacisoli TaxID=3064525 RepID=A0ABT9CFK2_9BACL|nr:rhodanese-related sulfurtransferase [Paenibacillus sp. JX-17]MDO7907981.1 rhodanese-related sulfurtransferase [Paenibacillus sp. JX-17]